ncbi:hypothetical protein IB234_15280 [Pseudomonas sp. PDM16]|uniref:hypothetical protein n=1 Tax=Pseudomonas sp. PDM16 TaxID=2769292 RepID=UPI00177CF512|nr:hypothetical protein [Pseudomonas sp. PDM16]MBD9415924.1 hypothetical protein [Pseudomonas sp. PDM16]
MNEQELIAAVKAAKTKDELEALVKAELSIDLDKRRKLEDLRADVLSGLGADLDPDADQEQDDAQQQEQQEQQEQQGGNTSQPLQQPSDLGGQGEIAPKEPVGQPVAEVPAPTAVPAAVVGGLLLETTPGTLEVLPEPPELEEEEEDWFDEEPAPANRLLRNRENGREFVWTPELAKLSHMEEVY